MRSDILLDANDDVLCENGDFATGPSDDQHVSMLLTLNKGELKESPTLGVGLPNFLKKQNNTLAEIKRDITVGLKADGYRVKILEFDKSGDFKLDYDLNE